jgi:HAD superfamily hydrolase (TIGR01549 family)
VAGARRIIDPLMKHTAIFFDFVNTLSDPGSDYLAHSTFLRRYLPVAEIGEQNLPRLQQRFEAYFEEDYRKTLAGGPFISMSDCHAMAFIRLVEKDLPPALSKQLANREADWGAGFMEQHIHYCNLYPEALPVVQVCRQAGYHVGLISDYDEYPLKEILSRTGLLSELDSITSSEEVHAYKPQAKIFQAALNKAGIAAQQAIYVGDRWERDVAGAKKMGMTAILVGDEKPGTPPPDFHLQYIRELPACLTKYD